MNRVIRFLKDWALPVSMIVGVAAYFLFVALPFGPRAHAMANRAVGIIQPALLFCMLFISFCKVDPGKIRLRRWHLWLALIQSGSFILMALIIHFCHCPENIRILIESAMICLICPTATAAVVVTDKLGGNLAGTVSYLVLINVAATFLIPLVIPVVNPSASMGFWAYVGHIALKVFPLLVLPGLLAWTIRYTTHKLQRVLMRWATNTFYVWGVGLTLAMVLATRALLLSGLGAWAIAGIVGVSILCCFVQFFAGRRLGAGDSITPGQTLGQKNTGFLIWLGYNYMTPVTSVAGGLYAIWQNLFNSWELYRKEKRAA